MAGDTAEKEARKVRLMQQQSFALHVLLIQRQESVTKSQALFTAWLEGPSGLSTRAPAREAPKGIVK